MNLNCDAVTDLARPVGSGGTALWELAQCKLDKLKQGEMCRWLRNIKKRAWKSGDIGLGLSRRGSRDPIIHTCVVLGAEAPFW
jgi:hypothetical protein